MKFGTYSIDKVEGAILAHSVRLGEGASIKKGTVLKREHIDLLAAAGHDSVTVAIAEVSDVLEDMAAARIANRIGHASIRCDQAKTGRVNFFAEQNGLFRVSKQAIDAINAIDPGVTVATLANKTEVNQGRMVATIKIIPYGVPKDVLLAVENLAAGEVMQVDGFLARSVGLVQTVLEGTKSNVLDKTRRMLERRLVQSGSRIVEEVRVEHSESAVASAIEQLERQCDLIILFGASAISDIRDVIPAGLGKAGGETLRFGMPVDPGNLLLLGTVRDTTVIGAPGCARGPAENGFDWVLNQVLADTPLGDMDIAGMGVGGLLMETGARPHPRMGTTVRPGKTIGVVLAAGQSRRMGDANKMTVGIDGKPMVRHVVEAALAAKLDGVLVVTGYRSDEVKTALDGLNVAFVHNPAFEQGLSTSLKAGVSNLDASTDRALVLLGDMPFVTGDMINRLIATGQESDAIVMATSAGKRGNPVLWPSRFFPELTQIEGDTGARHVIGANADQVVDVELGEAAALDLDTPDAVAAIRKP